MQPLPDPPEQTLATATAELESILIAAVFDGFDPDNALTTGSTIKHLADALAAIKALTPPMLIPDPEGYAPDPDRVSRAVWQVLTNRGYATTIADAGAQAVREVLAG